MVQERLKMNPEMIFSMLLNVFVKIDTLISLKLLHEYAKIDTWIWSCYVGLSKLLHGSVNVITCICQVCPLPIQTKLKFGSDFDV